MQSANSLIHRSLVTHLSVIKLAIIGSHKGLSPDRHQDTIRTNAAILTTWIIGTNLSEILDKIYKI